MLYQPWDLSLLSVLSTALGTSSLGYQRVWGLPNTATHGSVAKGLWEEMVSMSMRLSLCTVNRDTGLEQPGGFMQVRMRIWPNYCASLSAGSDYTLLPSLVHSKNSAKPLGSWRASFSNLPLGWQWFIYFGWVLMAMALKVLFIRRSSLLTPCPCQVASV